MFYLTDPRTVDTDAEWSGDEDEPPSYSTPWDEEDQTGLLPPQGELSGWEEPSNNEQEPEMNPTTEDLLTEYWDLQFQQEAMSQKEYEGRQGEALTLKQNGIARELEERLGGDGWIWSTRLEFEVKRANRELEAEMPSEWAESHAENEEPVLAGWRGRE